MLRATLLLLLVIAGCRHDTDPPPMQPKEGELPPLPPSSGTPVGYLIDNASTLKLRDDQLEKLKVIDQSLSARDDAIDTQLRLIEKPNETPQGEGGPPVRHNNAPGAQVHTTPDAAKLHAARRENDFEALQKAFALLDPEQQDTARKLLEDRGVTTPGGNAAKQPKREADDGTPLEP
jgi:hypothetical protein